MRSLYILVVIALLNSSCATFLSYFKKDEAPRLSSQSAFPPRRAGAITGSKFIAMTNYMTSEQREDAIYQQVIEGNVPSFLRKAQMINLSALNGRELIRGTIWVLPDYLAIGSDTDFVRMPMTPMTAQKIADRFGFSLPTTKLVNEIYRQAGIKLSPMPMPPGPRMVTNDYYRRHQNTIEMQLRGRRGRLVAGHKKDIVLTNRLARQPTRVAIYGWHRLNGKAIQPLSLVHGQTYADYSHGVRFIQNSVIVRNKRLMIQDVLRDSKLSKLVSDEGAIYQTRLRTY